MQYNKYNKCIIYDTLLHFYLMKIFIGNLIITYIKTSGLLEKKCQATPLRLMCSSFYTLLSYFR